MWQVTITSKDILGQIYFRFASFSDARAIFPFSPRGVPQLTHFNDDETVRIEYQAGEQREGTDIGRSLLIWKNYKSVTAYEFDRNSEVHNYWHAEKSGGSEIWTFHNLEDCIRVVLFSTIRRHFTVQNFYF